MNKLFWLLVILSSSAIAQIDTCLTFSEIMFFPDAGNSEFIEIFNLSPSDSFDLSLYKIKYQNASADFIKAGPAGSILKPLSYAVILEGDYDLTSGIYKSLLFNADLILKIDNNAFGSSGMSNSSGRELYLQNFDNDTIDHYTYSADNKAGISDEKIKMTSNNAPLNFSNSQFVHGTPGFRNSVSPVLKDISVCNFLYSPYSPLSGEVVRFSVQICNQGEQNIDSLSVKVAFSDTMSLNGNVIFFQDCSNLPSGDSLSLSFNYVFNTPGSFIIECEVILPVDQNIMNNKISGLLVISGTAAKYHDIIINEIMCAPADGEPEWIEFINASPEPVNLKDFTVSDILTSPATVKLSITDFYIPAGKYFILSRDSSLKAFHINIPSPIMLASMPVLNNDEDGVVLKDIRGTVIDSVHYDKSFDSKPGRSIEKKEIDYSSTDKNSWAPSTDIEKSTPGRINSISRKDFDLCASNVFCMPQPPIVAENIFLKLKVLNKGRKYAENSTARFLIKNAADTVYNLFSTTTFSLASGDSITLTASVPFTLNNSITVRGEISALLDEDISNNSITREIRPSFRRNNVLINEFMGDPETGEAEWVELLNASGQIINLNGWSVSDILPQPGKVQFCLHDFYFRPSELLVIARDSSLLKNHSGIKNFFTAKFGTLGNTSDGIIIYDAVNYIIDSIQYSAAWKGKKGFSFERFALHLP
ncbi:MAG: lamin tail domain-containing protein, partial [Methanococcaceae archaeon]